MNILGAEPKVGPEETTFQPAGFERFSSWCRWVRRVGFNKESDRVSSVSIPCAHDLGVSGGIPRTICPISCGPFCHT